MLFFVILRCFCVVRRYKQGVLAVLRCQRFSKFQIDMLTTTRAIVLKTVKYGESQIIADLLTMSHGRLSFIQRIPRTSKANVKKQLFQPMTLLDIVFDYRTRVNMLRIRDASAAFPAVSVHSEPAKLTIALFLAEFTSALTKYEQQNLPLFSFVEDSIRWLDATSASVANFHLVYMLHLSRFAGFFPNLDSRGRLFDLRAGAFSDSIPPHSDFLRGDEAERLRLLMRMDYANMRFFRFSRGQRNRCIDIIMKYYGLHLPGFPDMKSLEVLREVFA